jgi:DtxR family Mn-dependent transcriptional regulator
MTISAIIGLLAVCIAAAVYFAPRFGVRIRMRMRRDTAERIRIEDALKHMSDCEYRGIDATVESIAGALGISSNEAAQLVRTLCVRALATGDDRRCALTEEGRAYALRIVRTHRLLERFLADETLMGETEWHGRAERDEHHLSEQEIETLAARLGHPQFDPHGDPIPSLGGGLPQARGRSLAQLPPGRRARILHVEDEPASVYAKLVAAGIAAGAEISMHSRRGDALEVLLLHADGTRHAHTLGSIEAASVTVADEDTDANVTPDAIDPDAGAMKLGDVKIGASVVVRRITPSCRGQQRRRLMDLGIIPGTLITAELRSPGGDPVAYRVRDALIALRKRHADAILVDPAPAGQEL